MSKKPITDVSITVEVAFDSADQKAWEVFAKGLVTMIGKRKVKRIFDDLGKSLAARPDSRTHKIFNP